MLKKLLLSLALSVSLFAQHDASLNLSNDEIELKGNIDIGELNQSDYPDTYFITLGFLDVDNAQSTDPLLEAGFMLRQEIQAIQGLKFGLGVKGTYTEVSSKKHTAIPIGVELAYTLPIDFPMPIIVSGSLFYAPSMLSFQDAERYFEGRAEVSLQIVEQASIFLGYRQINTDFDGYLGNYAYSDQGYVGFKIRF